VPGGGHLGRDAHRGQGCVRHGWVAVVGRSRIGCFSSFASDFFSSSSLLLSSLELSNTGTRRREIWGATCSPCFELRDVIPKSHTCVRVCESVCV
jgi:hypothetical protein